MLICIEGPSAVGKTSTCKLLEKNNDAFIVKETIFKPLEGISKKEQTLYYLQKEVDRWNLAQEKLRTYSLVILDSDPLKPLWFNWAFSFINCPPLIELDRFFRDAIISEKIGFPDKFIILTASEQELHRRKSEDKNRRRPEFERLFCINQPRIRYYEFLNTLIPGIVEWIEAVDLETNYKLINSSLFESPPKKEYRDDEYFTKTINWIEKNTF